MHGGPGSKKSTDSKLRLSSSRETSERYEPCVSWPSDREDGEIVNFLQKHATIQHGPPPVSMNIIDTVATTASAFFRLVIADDCVNYRELAEKCLFAPPHEHCCTPTHPPPLRRKLCLTFTFSNLSFPTHNFQKRNYFSLISGSELSVWLCLLWWVCVSVFGKPKSSREPDFGGCSGCLDHFPKGSLLSSS